MAARLEQWAAELAPAALPTPIAKAPVLTRPEVILKQYAWDQTPDTVKIYVSLAGVGEPGAEVEVSD